MLQVDKMLAGIYCGDPYKMALLPKDKLLGQIKNRVHNRVRGKFDKKK